MFLLLSYKEYEEISTVKSGSRGQVENTAGSLDFDDMKTAGLTGARLIIFSDIFTFYSRAFVRNYFILIFPDFLLMNLFTATASSTMMTAAQMTSITIAAICHPISPVSRFAGSYARLFTTV